MELDSRSSEIQSRFAKRYNVAGEKIMREMERAVCGCDYGGSSWATEDEAQNIANSLALIPGKTLLEIGCGSGWPSLYIAHLTGCKATLTDVSKEGLCAARRRAISDGVVRRCRFVQVGGNDLPFDDESFDAINHSDVLCCLNEKIGVLKECRRVIRKFGTMAFSVIHMKDGATDAETQRVTDIGPVFAGASASYPDMLAMTGWRMTSQTDLTSAFHKALIRRIEEFDGRKSELQSLLGEEQYSDELHRLHMKLEFVEEGLIRRTIFVARP